MTLPVHCCRAVQARQSARLNSTDSRGFPSATVAFHRGLTVPCGHLGFALPVDVEVLLGEAGSVTGARVLTDRPDNGYRISGRRPVNRFGRDVAAVEIVFRRRDALLGQRGVDRLDDIDVLFRSRGCHNMHDEVRSLLVTGLGLVVLVADPFDLARLVAEPRLRIMRRHDLHPRPRHSSRLRIIIGRRGAGPAPLRSFPALASSGQLRLPPPQLSGLVIPVLLDPDLTQHLDSAHRRATCGRRRTVDGPQQGNAVSADLLHVLPHRSRTSRLALVTR
ncbi:hypothetical protein AAH979_18470 [Plantactinospora sp. ZYX-F-223]|uniref:hypothetical protein n=1 Tax=Plantactinospora sp. ZYX-F-223 TaxID=3144103 RepID=UPI0031FD1BF2